MGVQNLNGVVPICEFERTGGSHEGGQDAVCEDYGFCAVENLRTHHRATQGLCGCWRAGCADLLRTMAFSQRAGDTLAQRERQNLNFAVLSAWRTLLPWDSPQGWFNKL
jgi:hypothetical protein